MQKQNKNKKTVVMAVKTVSITVVGTPPVTHIAASLWWGKLIVTGSRWVLCRSNVLQLHSVE